MVIVEKLLEWGLAGETEVLGENLSQRHFVHHKSHMTRPEFWTRAAAVGSQGLTAWAMALPTAYNNNAARIPSWFSRGTWMDQFSAQPESCHAVAVNIGFRVANNSTSWNVYKRIKLNPGCISHEQNNVGIKGVLYSCIRNNFSWSH
jgi:hypothetical protein